MAEQMTLDEVLDDKEPEKPVETPVEKTVSTRRQHREKEMLAQGKDIEGQPLKKEEAKEAVKEVIKEPIKEEQKQEVKDDVTKRLNAAIAQANAERAKRQEYEKRIKELETKSKEPEKPFWEDPDTRFKTFEEKQTEFQRQLESRQQEREVSIILKTSEMLARREHKDFDEKVEYFGQMLQNTPGLYQEWLQSTDPGDFAYKTAKGHMDLQEAGSIDKLKERIEKETRAKIEAELKEKASKLSKEREELPGTLSDAKGVQQQRVIWGGPTPFDEIIK